jgi:hypothetical protein
MSHLVLCFAEPMAWPRPSSGFDTALLGFRARGAEQQATVQSRETCKYIRIHVVTDSRGRRYVEGRSKRRGCDDTEGPEDI